MPHMLTYKGNKVVTLSEKSKRLLKQAGESSVWGSENVNMQVIPFSSPTLNSLNGIGGVPRGRVILIAGEPSAGKTLISLDLVKNVEDAGGSALYIDAEFAYTPAWGVGLGIKSPPNEWVVRENNAVKIWEMLIGKPETWTTKTGAKSKDGVYGILYDDVWIKEDNLQLVIIDSLDSLVSPVQEGSCIGKQNMAPTPRFLSAELPRLVEIAARSNVTIVFILQVRTDLGAYGNPKSVSGGKAIRHAASVFYNVVRKGGDENPPIKDDSGKIIGHTVGCRIDKNKVGPPAASGTFEIKYTEGICNQGKEFVVLGIENGLIERPSSKKYIYKSDNKELEVVGKAAFIKAVSDDSEIIDDIKIQLIEKGIKI